MQKRLGAIETFVLLLALAVLAGCKSTPSGNSQAGGDAYYGAGSFDPWYYGDASYPPDVIATPPPERPEAPPQPAHPIALPPASAPRPTPMPSIPSTPRVSGRR